ncbi:MAG: LacI family DNA-binding transcriptional regulator [Lachnospiraceae bacterium]|nr:LacI family DNA-binding transcriptional regulator [Lachnospiraceae bacterium]
MTIKDIAKEAGVSSAAVSRYFNGGSLGEEKQKRIKAVVEKYHYVPNQAAQSMRTGKSGQIGVIVPKIHSDSLSQIMHGIADGLSENDYNMILGLTEGAVEKEVQYINMMTLSKLEGIILMGTTMTPHLRNTIERCPIPIVITGQAFEGFPCVYYDDQNAMRELAQLMLKKRKNIAYIGAPETDPAVGIKRKEGVIKAFKEMDKDPSKLISVETSGFDMRHGYTSMKELFSKKKKIDGVLCATDSLALGAMKAIREKKLSIPDDIAIAGIGNNLAGQVTTPELTTVRLYFEQCGQTAARMLREMIENGKEGYPISQIKLGYEIIERESI